ncbi:NADPH oxidase, partial [Aureobasidium melanogenum]
MLSKRTINIKMHIRQGMYTNEQSSMQKCQRLRIQSTRLHHLFEHAPRLSVNLADTMQVLVIKPLDDCIAKCLLQFSTLYTAEHETKLLFSVPRISPRTVHHRMVETTDHQGTRASQPTNILSMDIERCSISPQHRHYYILQATTLISSTLSDRNFEDKLLFRSTILKLAKIRQQSYETFWYTHHLFVPFLLALYSHATGCFVRDTVEPVSPFAGKYFWNHCLGYEGWRWELVGGGLYFLERIYREIRARRPTEIIKVVKHPYDAVEIQFRKPSMQYKAGQWLFLNCPEVSKHEWHPFTITSCPFDPYVSVHVRQVGDFTRSLSNALGAGPEQAALYGELDPMGMYEVALQHGQQMPRLRIDGPYGAPAEDVFDHEIAILVGTGIGVTPWASILKNIWHMRLSPNPPKRLKRVEFIWVCKTTTSFEWFQALLSSLEMQSLSMSSPPNENKPNEETDEFLKIHTYLTQKMDVDQANNIVLNSVGTTKDPLTELNSRTNFGRPDFQRLLGAMRDSIENGTYISGLESRRAEVGVYFCGPNMAARGIRKACHDESSHDVKFRFWKEYF